MFEARRSDVEALAEPLPNGLPPRVRTPVSDGSALRVGLLNNMPDAALAATERQFRRLIEAGGEGRPVELVPFSLDGLPRGPQARALLDAGYASHSALPEARLDALVVTGCEPRAGKLSDEPYFADLSGIIDWAERTGVPTLFSCLAAHAAVLHLDRIERRPLPAKHSGLYLCAPPEPHPLTAGMARPVPVPHSRWNDLAEADLVAAGYRVLRRSAEVGVDLFLRERGDSLFVFLQGHPEYDGDSLAREYRRDVGRYLSGEREDLPALPARYFPPETAARLEAFTREATARRSPELFAQFPAIDVAPPLHAAWQSAAARLFANWLALVAGRRVAASVAA